MTRTSFNARILFRTLLGTSALAAMAVPAQAWAQQDSDETAQEDDSDTTPVIVITAQGREQELIDVPIAVNVVSAEQLQNSGATDIRELNQLAPSLLVSSTGNEANGSARIRGIGTVGDNPGLESSVAVFIDGVYRSRSGNALGDLGPIDRIEVLRGPQGTLGGRNASAGLLNIFTAQPDLNGLEVYGNGTYGNYDYFRLEAGLNLPVGDTFAFRIDGTYTERDGFYNDITNDTTVNDRDRYLIRGKALWEPTSELSLLFAADYSKKTESCCAATFVQADFAPGARTSPGLNSFIEPTTAGVPLTSTGNPIIPILLALGQDPRALSQDTFNRNIYPTAGRSYAGETEDYGASLQIDYDLGGTVKLTSITGYREYSNNQASDADYTTVDILYRAPGDNAGARAFQTFTQELRLQGSAFNDRVDWLVGAFYSNEDLQVQDNLRFGTQYGAFAPCRIVLAINPALVSPGSTGCLSAGGRGVLQAANGGAGAFGAATPLLFAGLDTLASVNDVGGTGDVYNQTSDNFAFFTHNIIHLTDKLDLTLGLRYTNDNKDFDATFGNDNTFCPTNRARLSPLLTGPLAGLAGGLIALSCQGNSTSELDGVSLSDDRDEDEFTGTVVLSWKPNPDLLLYGSYSRGYKAGGFNLDRSALGNPLFNPATTGSTANLQFDQETVDAYEVGVKYSIPSFTVTAAAFRQEFSNFQLNTFNGSVFLVQTVNSCGTNLNGADRDASATTGACSPDDVEPGVISQGVELEMAVSPARNFNATAGLTYTDTSYENNLIGNDTGAPLDPALRLLPGDNLSNAPEITATASLSWTPELTDSGISALFFVNARLTDDFNTGSDLLYGKEQQAFVVVNARIGIRGPNDMWALEGWAQNLFNEDYTQVAFNTPFVAPQQTFSAFLAEPRTYGFTLRGRF